MLEFIVKGGPLMIPLLAESILTLAVVIERWRAYRVHLRVDSRSLRAKVLALLGDDRLPEAARLCAETPGPVASVLLAGLQAYAKHRERHCRIETLRPLIEDALEDQAYTAMRAVQSRLNLLTLVGSSAPLFGMTGTVTGMIRSFKAIAGAGALEGTLVAAGISEALITTAAGLLIAMAAVIPYHYFANRADLVESEIHEAASELLDVVTLGHAEAA